MLPSAVRHVCRNRSPSRGSTIITCAASIISFRIAELRDNIPGILNASICYELFKKTVSMALATALAF